MLSIKSPSMKVVKEDVSMPYFIFVSRSPMGLAYIKLFKTKIEISHHLLNIKNIKCRNIITKFRSGILDLEIEIGRWNKVPIENRVCKLCSLSSIEDEYHFLLICPYYYVNLRNTYLPKFYYTYPNVNKLKLLMCNTNLTKDVSNYLYLSYTRRIHFLATQTV